MNNETFFFYWKLIIVGICVYVCMVLIKTGARKVSIELLLDHIEIIDNYLFQMNMHTNQKEQLF